MKLPTLEEVRGSQMCKYSLLENNQAKLYRNQEKIYKLLQDDKFETRRVKMSMSTDAQVSYVI